MFQYGSSESGTDESRDGCACTLLGPEGPEHSIFGSGGLNLWTLSLFPFLGCGGGYRPYFENYTVDASILDSGIFVWITKID